MTIGNRIKNFRIQKKMTMEEVAKILNTSKQTIYKYENDLILNIPLDKIERLAEIFDTTPSYLLGIEKKYGSFETTCLAKKIANKILDFPENDLRDDFVAIQIIMEDFGYDLVYENDRYILQTENGFVSISEQEICYLVEIVKQFLKFQLNELYQKHANIPGINRGETLSINKLLDIDNKEEQIYSIASRGLSVETKKVPKSAADEADTLRDELIKKAEKENEDL